jgi:hypothetical protein
MAIATRLTAVAMAMARRPCQRSRSRVSSSMTRAATFDEAALAAGGLAQGGSSEAVEIAHGAGGGLVEERNGVGGKELAVAAGAAEAHTEVLGGVVCVNGEISR